MNFTGNPPKWQVNCLNWIEREREGEREREIGREWSGEREREGEGESDRERTTERATERGREGRERRVVMQEQFKYLILFSQIEVEFHIHHVSLQKQNIYGPEGMAE